MAKKRKAAARVPLPVRQDSLMAHPASPWVTGILLFFAVLSLYSFYDPRLKWTALVILLLALAALLLFRRQMARRFTLPLAALVLYLLLDGLSALYAGQTASGKLALYTFLVSLAACCLVLLLTALAPGGNAAAGRWLALVLACFSGAASLVSLDLLSTHFLSEPVLAFLRLLSSDFQQFSGVEAGVRMTSIFINPNIFAGLSGLGVLLSLGLAAPETDRSRRNAYLVLLYLNALAFVLSFSLGGTAVIIGAFLVYLVLDPRERRAPDLVLMLETFLLTMASAALVSLTSLGVWTAIQPIPLLCAGAGSALLCLADQAPGKVLADRLRGKSRLVPWLTLLTIALLAGYAVGGYLWTGDTSLAAGTTLRRAAYPAPGTYTLEVVSDHPVALIAESQSMQETMMHTSTVLYSGVADEAVFTVPEDSLVVYFNFAASGGSSAHLESASYHPASSGGEGSGSSSGTVPLGYRLFPSFMANRLQGIFANENAIQRAVFFQDGLKLFARSPLLGLGLAGFENSFRSVQSFWYETQNVHNHYIEVLVDKGIPGLAVFLFLLGSAAAAVWTDRRRQQGGGCSLNSALGAAIFFMAVHALVEMTFSSHAYLPIAFGTIAVCGLCCGKPLAAPGAAADSARNGEPGPPGKKSPQKAGSGGSGSSSNNSNSSSRIQSGMVLGTSVLLGVFALLLCGNLLGASMAQNARTPEALVRAARVDPYEWTDYAAEYLYRMQPASASEAALEQADRYAARLSGMESASTAFVSAQYYFTFHRTQEAGQALLRDLNRFASDPSAWQTALALLSDFQEDTPEYQEVLRQTAALLEEWNRTHLGNITLSEEGTAFLNQAS